MRKSFEEFEKDLKRVNPHLHILGRPLDDESETDVYCEDCGGIYHTKRFNIRKNMEHKRKGCPICAGRLVVKGVNDVATTAPYLTKFFVNEEDTHKYTRTSKVKVDTKCPLCGHTRKLEVGKMYARGYRCSVCGDGISYPNKFIRAFLIQVNVDNLQFEYHAAWLGTLSFDSYFEIEQKKYVVEMDGEQHFNYTGRGRSLEKEQANDRLKDELAEQHDITVIRIDCRISDRYYIQKNIENSALAKLFDMSSIDWDKCTAIACKSLVSVICDYYNTVTISTKEIAEHFHLNMSTVVEYLKQGASFGLCDFSYELARKLIGQKNRETWRKKLVMPVKVTDPDGKVVGVFKNNEECVVALSSMYKDICFNKHSIVCLLANKKGRTYYKNFLLERVEEKNYEPEVS